MNLPDAAASPQARPDAEPLLSCEHMSRHYRVGAHEIMAVDDVDASITPGLRLALTGPSGSGKSTLLHLWAGLEEPTGGRLRWPHWGGSPVGRPGTVGVVFQSPSLLPDLDVAENVSLPLLFASGPDAAPVATRELVVEALDRVGIEELAAKRPDELSGGQAQRVAVARVLVARPRLVLADEPTGRLDRETGDTVVSALLEVTGDLGAALVVATHDPRVAAQLTERWSMRDGRLRRAPATDEEVLS